MKLVYYTGCGAKRQGRHTTREFLNIMYREFRDKDWNKCSQEDKESRLRYKDFILPDEFQFFTLDDWIYFVGASFIYN
jgi:hypothetical protein